MAANSISKATLLVSLFIVINLVCVDFLEATEYGHAPSAEPIDCGAACAVRCSRASRHKMCLRACGTCCSQCHCVPPGTSGNEDVCPCYATMTTHGGRHKCP